MSDQPSIPQDQVDARMRAIVMAAERAMAQLLGSDTPPVAVIVQTPDLNVHVAGNVSLAGAEELLGYGMKAVRAQQLAIKPTVGPVQ